MIKTQDELKKFLDTHPACKAFLEECGDLPVFLCVPKEELLISDNAEKSEIISQSVKILQDEIGGNICG